FKALASFAVDPCGFGSSCPAVSIVACFSGISLVIAVSVQSSCCGISLVIAVSVQSS
ncbi:hypothetical protein NDU88_009233, partial [Pleurodeles waltl]